MEGLSGRAVWGTQSLCRADMSRPSLSFGTEESLSHGDAVHPTVPRPPTQPSGVGPGDRGQVLEADRYVRRPAH